MHVVINRFHCYQKPGLDTFVHRFIAYFDFMTYVQCGTSYSCALL